MIGAYKGLLSRFDIDSRLCLLRLGWSFHCVSDLKQPPHGLLLLLANAQSFKTHIYCAFRKVFQLSGNISAISQRHHHSWRPFLAWDCQSWYPKLLLMVMGLLFRLFEGRTGGVATVWANLLRVAQNHVSLFGECQVSSVLWGKIGRLLYHFGSLCGLYYSIKSIFCGTFLAQITFNLFSQSLSQIFRILLKLRIYSLSQLKGPFTVCFRHKTAWFHRISLCKSILLLFELILKSCGIAVGQISWW